MSKLRSDGSYQPATVRDKKKRITQLLSQIPDDLDRLDTMNLRWVQIILTKTRDKYNNEC